MKKFFQFSNYFFYIFFLLCALTPFVEKHITCQIYLPGLNESFYEFNTFSFWVLYIVQNLLVFFNLAAFKFYICLIVNFIKFGTTLMQILKYKIKLLSFSENHESKKHLNEEIVSCIKMHLDIKEYVLLYIFLMSFVIKSKIYLC